jgi:hypothetical protein
VRDPDLAAERTPRETKVLHSHSPLAPTG